MIDPYETMRKLLAISSPCGAPLPAIECRICRSFGNVFACSQRDCPMPAKRKISETMRRVNELGDLLARECPLRELFSAIQKTESKSRK